MKKFFGIIFLLGGMILFSMAVYALAFFEMSHSGTLCQVELSHLPLEDQFQAFTFLILGSSFFLIGIFLTTTKTRSQRRKEDELAYYKQLERDGQVLTAPSNDPILRLQRIAALYDEGILTEEEFQREKAKILNP